MNVIAVVLLGATALAGLVIWLLVERRSFSTPTFVALAAVPVLLLGVAALFGLGGSESGDTLGHVASATGVAVAASTGGLVATAMLRIADRRDRRDRLNLAAGHDDEPASVADVSDPRTLRGGASIGVLERIAVVTTLLAGWPEGLALILGIKGLGRYPELNRPPASERFIIGTLGSVLWAVAAAGVVHTAHT